MPAFPNVSAYNTIIESHLLMCRKDLYKGMLIKDLSLLIMNEVLEASQALIVSLGYQIFLPVS